MERKESSDNMEKDWTARIIWSTSEMNWHRYRHQNWHQHRIDQTGIIIIILFHFSSFSFVIYVLNAIHHTRLYAIQSFWIVFFLHEIRIFWNVWLIYGHILNKLNDNNRNNNNIAMRIIFRFDSVCDRCHIDHHRHLRCYMCIHIVFFLCYRMISQIFARKCILFSGFLFSSFNI